MKILLVVSNYNEENNIMSTLEDIQVNSQIELDVVVIDNWSNDSSIEIIKKSGVKYIHHPVNTGGGAGVIKTAFMYAFLEDYDIYCHMDGDNQHSAKNLSDIIQPILNGTADVVIGSRFISKEGFQSLFFRRLGINLFSSLVSMLTNYKITDITSGFRAFNKKTINLFGNNVKYEIDVCIQMIFILHYSGLSVVEVPVIMKPRVSGKSEIDLIKSLKFPVYGLITIIGTLLNKKRYKGFKDAV